MALINHWQRKRLPCQYSKARCPQNRTAANQPTRPRDLDMHCSSIVRSIQKKLDAIKSMYLEFVKHTISASPLTPNYMKSWQKLQTCYCSIFPQNGPPAICALLKFPTSITHNNDISNRSKTRNYAYNCGGRPEPGGSLDTTAESNP